MIKKFSPAHWTKSGTNLSPIDLTANVGIGTAAPTSKLDVQGANTLSLQLKQTSGNTDNSVDLVVDRATTNQQANLRWRTGGGERWAFGSDRTSVNNLYYYSYGGGGYVMFLNYVDGRVGFNTVSPSAKLDVHGTGTTTGVTFQTADSAGTANITVLDNGLTKIERNNIVLPKTSGVGIQVDTTTPTFGYRDLLGEIKILSPGANDPTLAVFRNNIRAFSFSNAVMNEANFHYHIPHDYVPGSDIFIHAHWSQNVVDSGGAAGVPGVVKWQYEVTYAKGHDQAAFPATFTTSVTQTASVTQYQHMLVELQLSATSPSATQINSALLEPDGMIIVRAFRDPTDAADTLNQVPFMHFSDIHYQSSNIATKNKTPNFYA
jgi:hypothetical protein